MQNDHQNMFTNAILTGLFIGIIDTLICLTYNITYRNYTGYTPSELINVSSLIFAVNLLLLFAGIVFAILRRLFGQKDYIYIILSALVTVFLAWKTEMGHRFTDSSVNAEFKGLLLGVVLVLG